VDGKKIIVSQCLRGVRCNYDNNESERQLDDALCASLGLICVGEACPEVLGGLSVPRDRMEIKGGDGLDVINGKATVVTGNGEDTTMNMIRGAQETVKIAKQAKVDLMITRRRSPSCSCSEIYDGTFTNRRKPGIGVTVALLRENNIETIELEQLVEHQFKEEIKRIHQIYRSSNNWGDAVRRSVSRLSKALTLTNPEAWQEILSDIFREMIPMLNQSSNEGGNDYISDSDTVRFYNEIFLKAYNFELLNSKKRCLICTYPEGFLDSYIGKDGICSACKAYQKFHQKYNNKEKLKTLLKLRLTEAKQFSNYQALAACSGGKDSTYMLFRLKKHYDANVLSVMDDLGQQNAVAFSNFVQSASALGIDTIHLPPIQEEMNIRRNFLRAGNSFCRLCLRSHFVRIYEVALKHKIPYVFFGLSPYQCLDCEDVIAWTERAILDLNQPFGEQNKLELLRRYEHRAFQGGFDIGFQSKNELTLLNEWRAIFHVSEPDFVPIIVPFFIFDGYPKQEFIMQTIQNEAGWRKPEVILDRTNCKHLRMAGIVHRAVGRYHLNYKERATILRMKGEILTDEQAQTLGAILETESDPSEAMTWDEFEEYLQKEFKLKLSELPHQVLERLKDILINS
jgi:uncharacterized protein YbbK (DUF523 family)